MYLISIKIGVEVRQRFYKTEHSSVIAIFYGIFNIYSVFDFHGRGNSSNQTLQKAMDLNLNNSKHGPALDSSARLKIIGQIASIHVLPVVFDGNKAIIRRYSRKLV